MSLPRIIVALSGGVDSAVSALLLKRQGYPIEAMFMKNWEDDDEETLCRAGEGYTDAKVVATQLGIPLHTVNFSAEYWDRVFARFLEEYRAGRTPNPDVLCNREIKFDAFLKHALSLGGDKIATGHYARIRREGSYYSLLKGRDPEKDQSYFLCLLTQEQLSHVEFPLGEWLKTDVRKLAASVGFRNAEKHGSTGICFIGERRFQAFLSRYLSGKSGVIETVDGAVLGEHLGLLYYTIGQRQGLGIGGQAGCPESPWYVVGKDQARNALIVAPRDHPALFSRALEVEEMHWIRGEAPAFPCRCTAKIRYRQPDQACRVEDVGVLRVEFVEPQRAVTPGQTVVFYQGAECLGGGTIARIASA